MLPQLYKVGVMCFNPNTVFKGRSRASKQTGMKKLSICSEEGQLLDQAFGVLIKGGPS